jgi:diaminopimelate epimerase
MEELMAQRQLAFTKMTGAGNDFIVLDGQASGILDGQTTGQQVRPATAPDDTGLVTADRITANQATADRITANQATADRITANQATVDRITANQATADRITANKPLAASIRRLCDRRYGIGADGLMLIRPGCSGIAFTVDFWNADGSGGMLCGNGARCALTWAAAAGLVPYGKTVHFSFAGRDYTGSASDASNAIFNLDPRYRTRLERLPNLLAAVRFVDLGSPHLVVDIGGIIDDASGRPFDNITAVPVDSLGRQLRWDERFAPEGVNVNFCALLAGSLHVRTFERGVEGETLACGTGSSAAALSYALAGNVKPPVTIVTRSGEELTIDFDDAAKPTRLSLAGPAQCVFTGTINLA